MGVLRKVAEFARDTNGARGGEHVSGDDAGECGLACAVSAHQADLVTLRHMEVRRVQQRAGTDLNLKSLRVNRHGSPSPV